MSWFGAIGAKGHVIVEYRRILFILLVAFLATPCCSSPDSRPPDLVVLVTVDTLRSDHLGLYGYPRKTSPFLDSLSRSSVVFDNVVSSSSHTAPSHVSLFTSLYPTQHGVQVNGQDLDQGIVTLTDVFKRAGYTTGAFTTVTFLDGLKRSFDHFSNSRQYNSSAALVDRALEWIRGLPGDSRQLLWLHLFDVHEWYREKSLNPELLDHWETVESSQDRERWRRYLLTRLGAVHDQSKTRSVFEAVDRYDAELLGVDRALHRLYVTLTDSGLNERALWVVTSDHGEGLGNHDYMGHGRFIYNEQIRIPLLFHSTYRAFKTRRIPYLIRQVDIAPTLSELIGGSLAIQAGLVMGRSFRPLLEGRRIAWEDSWAFSERRPADAMRLESDWEPGEIVSLQDSRFKYILRTDCENEFFDLRLDPRELTNLAGRGLRQEQDFHAEITRRYWLMKRQGSIGVRNRINPEYLEQLRSLGYIEH